MPFLGVDPWRWQYFAATRLPRGLAIPIDDASAWTLHPERRHVHDKLFIATSQGLDCGPHGVTPKRFPVFSKPIVNLKGMGIGSRVIATRAEYEATTQAGHMWMTLLRGAHVSTDAALARGRPRWWRHTTGKPGPRGTFDHWHVHAARRPRLEADLARWFARALPGFSGIVNVETIGGRIIECHLRMAEQWLDLNGPGWLDAVVGLHASGRWRFADRDRRDGYSVVLFAPHGRTWSIDARDVARVRSMPGVSSVQITFAADKPADQHAMPPGGFRLAIVNAWSLDAGRRARRALKRAFRAS
jgi:hypothetical protein